MNRSSGGIVLVASLKLLAILAPGFSDEIEASLGEIRSDRSWWWRSFVEIALETEDETSKEEGGIIDDDEFFSILDSEEQWRRE